MLDCVIEHFPIIGVEDLPTPYAHESQLTRPHARVVTQRLGDGRDGVRLDARPRVDQDSLYHRL